MSNKLQQQWAKHGTIHVLDINDEFFMVRFSDEGDYSYALFEDPWHVLDHYLMVQRWRSLFDTADHKVKKLVVWVRIPNLLLELYNNHFLWRVGAMLGTMLRIDDHTSIHSRGKFARLCVEVDLQRELVPSFTVLGRNSKLSTRVFISSVSIVGNMVIGMINVLSTRPLKTLQRRNFLKTHRPPTIRWIWKLSKIPGWIWQALNQR